MSIENKDCFDKELIKKFSNVKDDIKGFSINDIENIILIAEKRKRKKVYSFFLLATCASFIFLFCINFLLSTKINLDVTGIKVMGNKTITLESDDLVYAQSTDSNLNYRAENENGNAISKLYSKPKSNYVKMELIKEIYVIKIKEIMPSTFKSDVPITKVKADIVETIKGNKVNEIEFNIEWGIYSIRQLRELNKENFIPTEYMDVDEKGAINNFIQIMSENNYENYKRIGIGKYFIVSLDEYESVIENCDYPFLEFNIENNTYYKDGQWKTFD